MLRLKWTILNRLQGTWCIGTYAASTVQPGSAVLNQNLNSLVLFIQFAGKAKNTVNDTYLTGSACIAKRRGKHDRLLTPVTIDCLNRHVIT